jgi:formate-dependent phosphoribosylglycinamide formyltransferase (GAR transformylase)
MRVAHRSHVINMLDGAALRWSVLSSAEEKKVCGADQERRKKDA